MFKGVWGLRTRDVSHFDIDSVSEGSVGGLSLLLASSCRGAVVIEAAMVDYARVLRASLTWGWQWDPADLKVHMEQMCQVCCFLFLLKRARRGCVDAC